MNTIVILLIGVLSIPTAYAWNPDSPVTWWLFLLTLTAFGVDVVARLGDRWLSDRREDRDDQREHQFNLARLEHGLPSETDDDHSGGTMTPLHRALPWRRSPAAGSPSTWFFADEQDDPAAADAAEVTQELATTVAPPAGSRA